VHPPRRLLAGLEPAAAVAACQQQEQPAERPPGQADVMCWAPV
jgi:hypothetical protein